jgi:hypothetical protein
VSVFDYPKILKEPTTEIVASFRETAVMSWFLVLMISAALLAPVGVALGRIAGDTRGAADCRPWHRCGRRPSNRLVALGALLFLT